MKTSSLNLCILYIDINLSSHNGALTTSNNCKELKYAHHGRTTQTPWYGAQKVKRRRERENKSGNIK